MSVGIAVVIYHKLSEALGGLWLMALAIVILVAWSAIGAWLTVRAMRLGVYRDGVGRMEIRSLVHTWTLQVGHVRGIQIFEGTGGWGRSFYLPVVVVGELRGRRSIFLWWLSAMTEPKVQDYIARIRALVAAEGDAAAGGDRG